ncbi:MAG TPA: carboxypeptidase regulatory-like domain-containing protein [Thermomonas sp.]|nr:carboxypeptidase regulatory-like domain-containing protein [Thermomonas sp.]
MATHWPAHLLPWLLGSIALLACVRLCWPLRRLPVANRPRRWRTGLLLLGQCSSAALLFLLLRTPEPTDTVHTLHLLTAHAPAGALPVAAPGERWLRLPEAPSRPGIASVPDLASALRRHPGVRHLHLVGDGLEARDREAALAMRIRFDPAPLATGIDDWWAPRFVHAGETFRVQGRARHAAGMQVELTDPAGFRVDQQVLQDDGRFSLQARARSPGLADYQLRLRRADHIPGDGTRVPMQVLPATPARLLLRAGGPDPDLKFLRRWAADNGASLRAAIDLGGGMQAGDPVAVDTRTLAGIDVLVLDDRSWNGLGRAQRATVLDAVDNGMGLLLRASMPLADSDALGLQVRAAQLAPTFRLAAIDPAQEVLPTLGRPQLRIDNPFGNTLLRDDRGTPLVAWRTRGRGRIAAWLPTDSFRLVLAGHADVHARAWADAINSVMRARVHAPKDLPLQVYAGERTLLCDLDEDARVIAPGNAGAMRLAIDPRSGPRGCAAFWPQNAGWHRLLDANTDTAFLVRASDADPVLRASRTQRATRALAARASTSDITRTPAGGLARWALFLAWLALTAGLWWFERSRHGRVRAATTG